MRWEERERERRKEPGSVERQAMLGEGDCWCKTLQPGRRPVTGGREKRKIGEMAKCVGIDDVIVTRQDRVKRKKKKIW